MCLSPGVKCRIVLWPWREQHASQVQTVSYRDVETVLRTRIERYGDARHARVVA